LSTGKRSTTSGHGRLILKLSSPIAQEIDHIMAEERIKDADGADPVQAKLIHRLLNTPPKPRPRKEDAREEGSNPKDADRFSDEASSR